VITSELHMSFFIGVVLLYNTLHLSKSGGLFRLSTNYLDSLHQNNLHTQLNKF